MKRLAWVAALTAAWAGAASAQPPSRAPIAVAKVTAAIADGVEWGQGGEACPARAHLRWNMGEGVVDVSRLAQAVRAELRQKGVQVAGDPDDPFGANITSDLMLGATIIGLQAKVCGGDTVSGHLEMEVLWQLFSNSQKKVIGRIRTRITRGTLDKPVPLQRLVYGAVSGSTEELLLNGTFEAALLTGGAGLTANGPGAPAAPAAPSGQALYGAGAAHGDFLPHPPLETLVIDNYGAHGMRIDDTVQSVVAVLRPGSIGSGFLVSREGYIVSAAHVVGAERFVRVRWSDGFEATGEVVRRDNRRDVALIKTDAHGGRPLAMKIEAPRVGDTVFAVGAPVALQGTVTRGIVSAARTLDGFSFIQSDAAVNPGNSGGPMLNQHGEVLGIALLSNRANPGINFFAPIGDALIFLGVEAR